MAARKAGSTRRAKKSARRKAQREEENRRKRRQTESKAKRAAAPKKTKKQAKKAAAPKRAKKQAKRAATPKRKRRTAPTPKRAKKAAPPPRRRQKPKASRPGRSKRDKALRELLAALGGKRAAKRLGKSERTIEQWIKRGAPKRAADDIVRALERRKAGQKGYVEGRRKQTEEWNEWRADLFAQKNSEMTQIRDVVSPRLNSEGEVLGWGRGGTIMQLYCVVTKETGDRRWYWTPRENLVGYDNAEKFTEFYKIDPDEFEVMIDFGWLLTDKERAAGGVNL